MPPRNVDPDDPEGVGPETEVVVGDPPVAARPEVFHKPGDGGGVACSSVLSGTRRVERREEPQARPCLFCFGGARRAEQACPFCGADAGNQLPQHLTTCPAVPDRFRGGGGGG